MTKTMRFYPVRVEEPQVGTRLAPGEVDQSWCRFGSANPRHHGYFNLENLIGENKNGEYAQCGYPATKQCNYKTFYDIKGFRNTCPIAGVCGTYNKPAELEFYFDFSKLEKGIKIQNIRANIEQDQRGVDVSNGKIYNNWGPKFRLVELYFSTKNNRLTQDNHLDGPKAAAGWITRNTMFVDPDLTEENVRKSDFSLRVRYGPNENTNPGFIRLRNIFIEIEYEPALEPVIFDVSKNNEIITQDGEDSPCRTTLEQIIKLEMINPDNAIEGPILNTKPSDEQIDIGLVNEYLEQIEASVIPDNIVVKKKKIDYTNRQVIFEITDKSGIVGDKSITYEIKNKTSCRANFKSKLPDPAMFDIVQRYVKDYPNGSVKEFNPDKAYITLLSGCYRTVEIYIDGITQDNDKFTYTRKSTETSSDNFNKAFYEKMVSLTCGNHTLYFVVDGVKTQEKRVTIDSHSFTLSLIVPSGLKQNKQDRYQKIKILPVYTTYKGDDYTVVVKDESRSLKPEENHPVETTYNDIAKKGYIEHEIDLYYGGTFQLQVSVPTQCRQNKITYTLNITPQHRQYYDELFVRVEDGTSVKNDYLAVWEGDNIPYPIKADNIELISSLDDLRVCSDDAYTSLSTLGYATLRLKNTKDYDMKGIKIELNPIIEEDGERKNAASEFIDKDGMFYGFYDKFYILNPYLENSVEVRNLTEDDDIIDEENVYLYINTLFANEQMDILIPFECRFEKTVDLEFLTFENPIKFRTLDSCDIDEVELKDHITLRTVDSCLVKLDITGETDLNEAVNCCYFTDLTYKIENIDTIDLLSSVQLAIENSIEMNPYKYTYHNENYEFTADGNSINQDTGETGPLLFIKNIETKTLPVSKKLINVYYINNNEIVKDTVRSQNDGRIVYNFTLPADLGSEYTMEQLMNKFFIFESEETIDFGYASVGANIVKKDVQIKINDIVDIETNSSVSELTKGKKYKIYGSLKNDIDDFINDEYLKIYYLNEDNQSIRLGDRITTTINNDSNFMFTIIPDVDIDKTMFVNNYLNITYNGSAFYNSAQIGYFISSQPATKDKVELKYQNTYRRYGPGDVVTFYLDIESKLSVAKSKIQFISDLSDRKDEVTISYRICKKDSANKCLNDIYKTTFKTDDINLVKNEISKNIYCGIDTEMELYAVIVDKIIEQNNFNFIYVTVKNGLKPNKDVKIVISLGEYDGDEKCTGAYEFIDITTQSGDYGIDVNNNVLYYIIDEMDSYTEDRIIIKVKSRELGESIVTVEGYDYMHKEEP